MRKNLSDTMKSIYNESGLQMDSFRHFCPEHIGMLIFIAVAITAGLLFMRNLSKQKVSIAVILLSIAALASEVAQDVLLIREGGDIIGFLPLHLCNLGLFVNLIAVLSRGKIQSFFAEISLVLIMPGSVAALIFPDWTYRPFWSYLPLLCFFTHSLTVFISLVFLFRGKIYVTFRHFWYSYLFLLITVPPIYLFNSRTGQNYMFLSYPPSDTPLKWLLSLTGEKFYLLGLLALITAILIIEYTVHEVAHLAAIKLSR